MTTSVLSSPSSFFDSKPRLKKNKKVSIRLAPTSLPSRPERVLSKTRLRTLQLVEEREGLNEEILRQQRASSEAVDQTGFNTVHKAVLSKQYNMLKGLIKKGVNLNLKSSRTEMTALIYAARNGDHEGVLLLLSSHCSINEQDKNGWTALHHSSINNHHFVTEILIYMGIDLFLKGKHDETALTLSPTSEMHQLIKASEESLLSRALETQQIDRHCFYISKNGGVYSAPEFFFELDVPKLAFPNGLYCILKRTRASCCHLRLDLDLDQGLRALSDVYELWPFDHTISGGVGTVAFPCANEEGSEEAKLYETSSGVKEGSLVREKPRRHESKDGSLFEGIQKFALTNFGQFFAVGKQPPTSVLVPRNGVNISSAGDAPVNIRIPKLGLNSVSHLTVKVNPVPVPLKSILQSRYDGLLLSTGPLVQLTHSEGELRTRRMITMGVPLPEDYSLMKKEGCLVVVSGAGDAGPTLMRNMRVVGNTVEFPTRHLSWKISILIKPELQSTVERIASTIEQWIVVQKQQVQFLLLQQLSESRLVVECVCEERADKLRKWWSRKGWRVLKVSQFSGSDAVTARENEAFRIVLADRSHTLEFHSKTRSYKEFDVSNLSNPVAVEVFRNEDIALCRAELLEI